MMLRAFLFIFGLNFRISEEVTTCTLSSMWGDNQSCATASVLSVNVTSNICNIPKVGKITNKVFLDNFAFKSPVIFEGVTDNAKFRERCLVANLLKDYGHKTVTLSTANTHSYHKTDMTFEKYISEVWGTQDISKSGSETLYFFGNHNFKDWEGLFRDYTLPPYELPNKGPAFSFGLAGAGTGVPFHFHGPGFAEVIHGRKRWFLSPYELKPDFDPNETTLKWVADEYPTLNKHEDFYECVLEPNEILFFPDKWWHATLNLEDSVFISTFLG